jgi:histone H3/H4
MEENKRKNNSLIKRNVAIEILKERGIKRVNSKAIEAFGQKLEEKARIWAEVLERKLIINGRKTLKERDMIEIDLFEKKVKEKEEFEI